LSFTFFSFGKHAEVEVKGRKSQDKQLAINTKLHRIEFQKLERE
jgi:hypothetical protein